MRAYLGVMLGTAVVALVAVALVNLAVDPFAIHGTPAIAGFNELKPALAPRARLSKTVAVARGRWEALIIGTSRAEIGIDPQHPFFGGRRCFNAAMGAQPYEEGLALVEAAIARGALRQVLAVLDFPVSNALVAYPRDFTAANYAATRSLEMAFSAGALVESLRTARSQDRESVRQDVGLWLRDGRFTSPAPSDHRAHALDSERFYLADYYFPAPSFRHAFSAGGREPLAHVRRLIARAHAEKLELAILIGPAHARQWETVAVAGRWDLWEEWKRRLVMMNEDEARRAGRAPFPLWDFSGYNWMTTEPFPEAGDRGRRMTWYWESSHFVKEAGDRVLDRVAGKRDAADDFGVLLSSPMLESHLNAIRRGREEWKLRYPVDVAEIEALGREGRELRERLRAIASRP